MENKKGCVIWLTGLPGAGKTTIANILKEMLVSKGRRVEVLDGDEVRSSLSPDLGFSKQDRELHAKRVAYVGRLLSRNGVITIVALISPYRSSREYARNLVGDFVEIWVKCSIETCQKRDPKGLYKKAARGKVTNLTGVQDPYEPPLHPDLILDTEQKSPSECAEIVMIRLRQLGYLN